VKKGGVDAKRLKGTGQKRKWLLRGEGKKGEKKKCTGSRQQGKQQPRRYFGGRRTEKISQQKTGIKKSRKEERERGKRLFWPMSYLTTSVDRPQKTCEEPDGKEGMALLTKGRDGRKEESKKRGMKTGRSIRRGQETKRKDIA